MSPLSIFCIQFTSDKGWLTAAADGIDLGLQTEAEGYLCKSYLQAQIKNTPELPLQGAETLFIFEISLLCQLGLFGLFGLCFPHQIQH